MDILEKVAEFLDFIIGISLLIAGMYYFFYEKDFITGAFIFGMEGLFSIPVILERVLDNSKRTIK